MARLTGKVAIVTGAAQGMGEALRLHAGAHYPLEQTGHALEEILGRQVIGKIVITP